MISKDEEGKSNAIKLVIGIAALIFLFFMLMYVAVEIYLIPENILSDFFLPDGARGTVNDAFDRPIISTGQEGIVALPTALNTVSSDYGWRFIPGRPDLSFHEGIDFPVAFGSQVMAVAPGRVADTGVSRAYGSYILIEHQMIRLDGSRDEIERETFYSFYAHLFKVYVFEGQEVEQRRQIALSGGDPARHFSGNSTGAHLHLELRRTTEYATHFDPYEYVLDPDSFDGDMKSVEWGTV